MPYDDDSASALVAAPRHLRRRRFHSEIPDPLLVPDVEPYIEYSLPTASAQMAKRAAKSASPEETSYRRKRLVALMLVTAVLISFPALIAALVFAG